MTRVEIRTGGLAGFAAELVERGETSSSVKVVISGREAVLDLPNDSFVSRGEPFDPFERFAELIRADRRWEARLAAGDWWLERANDLSAATWSEHLERHEATEASVLEETRRLVERLRDSVSVESEQAEITACFRGHQALFRPFRWRRSQQNLSDADHEREDERARTVAGLQRVAFRAWWSAQPRSTGSCREFLEAAWSGNDPAAMNRSEHEAFDRWGREAVERILNHHRDVPFEVTELDALPEGHPWAEYRHLDPGAAVRRGFAALGDRARTVVQSLAHHVRALYVIARDGDYSLVYACDVGDRLSLVVGGPRLDERELATIDERLTDHVRSCGWRVPDELRALYGVHHGLGQLSAFCPRFDEAGSVVPADDLAVIGEIMNGIAEEQGFEPKGYRFDDLLAFFGDGAGNSQAFFRRVAGEPPVGTVDWDHETREIGPPRPFWEFLQGDALQSWLGPS